MIACPPLMVSFNIATIKQFLSPIGFTDTLDPNTENVFALPTAIPSSTTQLEGHVMFSVLEGQLQYIPAEPMSSSPKCSQHALQDSIKRVNSITLVAAGLTAHDPILPAHSFTSGSSITIMPLPAQVSMQAPGNVAEDSAHTTDTSVPSPHTAESIPSLPPSSVTPSVSP